LTLLRHPHLTHLDIAVSEVTAAGVQAIKENTTLVSLMIDTNHLEAKQEEALWGEGSVKKTVNGLFGSIQTSAIVERDRFLLICIYKDKSTLPSGVCYIQRQFVTQKTSTIDFSHIRLIDRRIPSLLQIPSSLPTEVLRTVNARHLSHVILDDNLFAIDMTAFSELHNVTRLSLNKCQLNDAQAIALANHVRQHPQLFQLHVTNNDIGNAGMNALGALPHLTYLSANNNCIGNRGITSIAESKTLNEVELNGNQITCDGAIRLASSKAIRKLYIGTNRIADAGAQAFSTNQILTDLHIANNNITKAGIAFFHGTQLITFSDDHNIPEIYQRVNRNKRERTDWLWRSLLIILHRAAIKEISKGDSKEISRKTVKEPPSLLDCLIQIAHFERDDMPGWNLFLEKPLLNLLQFPQSIYFKSQLPKTTRSLLPPPPRETDIKLDVQPAAANRTMNAAAEPIDESSLLRLPALHIDWCSRFFGMRAPNADIPEEDRPTRYGSNTTRASAKPGANATDRA